MTLYLPALGATEVKDYEVDFSTALAEGESLVSQTVSAVGVALGAVERLETLIVVTVAGTGAESASFTITATTSAGNKLVETVVLSTGEPVTVEEAKARLRIMDSDASRDAEIAALIKAARAKVENFTGLVLTPRTVVEQFDRFGAPLREGYHRREYNDCLVRRGPGPSSGRLVLSAWPVRGAPTVDYIGADGVSVGVSGVQFIAGGRPAVVFAPLSGWPSLPSPAVVRVSIPAGFADRAALDAAAPDLATAILMLVALWFDNPAAAGDKALAPLPIGVESICWDYRLPGA